MNLKNNVLDRLIKVKYIDYVPPSKATGSVANVYQAANKEFGAAADPIVVHSLMPNLLASFYALGREILLVTNCIPRASKEAIATAVSVSNRCPYCIDAHSIILSSLQPTSIGEMIQSGQWQLLEDEQLKALINWFTHSNKPNSDVVQPPPFTTKEAPELIGTALFFHYVNRVVNVFVKESQIPNNFMGDLVRRLGPVVMTSFSKQHLTTEPTRGMNQAIDPVFHWAEPNQGIAAQLTHFKQQLQVLADEYIPQEVQTVVNAYLSRWQGEDPPLGRAWIHEAVGSMFPETFLPVAKVALLAAFAPYQIGEADIAAYRQYNATDQALFITVSWASFAAALKISEWLAQPLLERSL